MVVFDNSLIGPLYRKLERNPDENVIFYSCQNGNCLYPLEESSSKSRPAPSRLRHMCRNP